MLPSIATTHPAPHRSYHVLPAWQRAMDLMAACYALTRRLPERAELALPLRHAALAVADGIATGISSRTRPLRRDHLIRARCALREVERLLRIADERGHLGRPERQSLARLVGETGRRLRELTEIEAGHSRPPNSSASTRGSIAPV